MNYDFDYIYPLELLHHIILLHWPVIREGSSLVRMCLDMQDIRRFCIQQYEISTSFLSNQAFVYNVFSLLNMIQVHHLFDIDFMIKIVS